MKKKKERRKKKKPFQTSKFLIRRNPISKS